MSAPDRLQLTMEYTRPQLVTAELAKTSEYWGLHLEHLNFFLNFLKFSKQWITSSVQLVIYYVHCGYMIRMLL